MAVNVTCSPWQILVFEAVTETVGVSLGVTEMLICCKALSPQALRAFTLAILLVVPKLTRTAELSAVAEITCAPAVKDQRYLATPVTASTEYSIFCCPAQAVGVPSMAVGAEGAVEIWKAALVVPVVAGVLPTTLTL